MDGSKYCVYEGKAFPISEIDVDHVIPRSLGGVNSFVVPASSKFNNTIGSKLEGAVEKDFIIKSQRCKFDIRGHSRKRPIARVKSGLMVDQDIPVQIEFDSRKGDIKHFSPRHSRYLKKDETAGKKFFAKVTMAPTARMRFAAKVALGAGYFTFGQSFVESVRVDLLRRVMNYDVSVNSEAIRGVGCFDEVTNDKHLFLQTLGKVLGLSTVIIVIAEGHVTFIVTCLQEKCGTIKVLADTGQLPKEGDFEWGHILACEDGLLRRSSLRYGTQLLNSELKAMSAGDGSLSQD